MELPVPQGQNGPQNVPEDEDQVVPEIEPQNMQQGGPPVGADDEPQVVPDIEAEDDSDVDSEPEDDPDVDIVNVSEPEDDIMNVDSEPEDEPQVVPEFEPPVEPNVGPQVVPEIEAEDDPDVDIMNVDSEPEDDPDVDVVNVSEPEDEPDVDIVNVDSEPEDEPQVGPDVEPQVVPEVEPYVEIIRDERTEDEWNELMKRAEFKKEDMNMMVMDFLLAQGLLPAAQAFQKESGCPIPLDSEKLALVETQKIVKDYIFNRQFDGAIHALNEILTPAFLEARPRVRFLLEQQKMIELCRARQFDEALKFSHEFIRWESVELGDDSFKKECRSTMLLMAYGDDDSSPASDLLDTNRMTTTSQYVVDNMKTYHGIPTGSHIENAVKMVIHEDNELNKKVLHPCFNFDTGCPKLFYQ